MKEEIKSIITFIIIFMAVFTLFLISKSILNYFEKTEECIRFKKPLVECKFPVYDSTHNFTEIRCNTYTGVVKEGDFKGIFCWNGEVILPTNVYNFKGNLSIEKAEELIKNKLEQKIGSEIKIVWSKNEN